MSAATTSGSRTDDAFTSSSSLRVRIEQNQTIVRLPQSDFIERISRTLVVEEQRGLQLHRMRVRVLAPPGKEVDRAIVVWP